MTYLGGLLIFNLLLILGGAFTFTNAVEWFGRRFGFNQGAVGSIFAAVGTALPETMVPVIAIFFGSQADHSTEIGIGAILGAPFMLITIGFMVTGTAALLFSRRRAFGSEVVLERKLFLRDIKSFLLFYSLSYLAAFVPRGFLQRSIALILVLGYLIYVYKTVNEDSGEIGEVEPLIFTPQRTIPRIRAILLQLAISLLLIVVGAKYFVANLTQLAHLIGISPMALSLVITPIATELPEKFNSVVWMKSGKDTLAVGNITGAMVFQSSVITSIGIIFTPWHLSTDVVLSGIMAFFAALAALFLVNSWRRLSAWTLIFNGCIYIFYLIYIFNRRIA
ncbi:hypothetical protein ciss_06100 [Carboxydothermus islandicus]|uniref:Sodium/calcium exchanger membrane region domain-containing protein n=1 Tax=Carboxydothermus islandicus TaxID=661089 RepID=A0A1L8D0L8_9THEO|nr:sodium:calcium antiporter [Carboxydothermus islandicus]GAV24677.1 hypothetical protein ciss_06100 [Carboxydothermus islandicus]